MDIPSVVRIIVPCFVCSLKLFDASDKTANTAVTTVVPMPIAKIENAKNVPKRLNFISSNLLLIFANKVNGVWPKF